MELHLTVVPSTPSILTRLEHSVLQLTRDLSHLAVKVTVLDDMSWYEYRQQPRATYYREHDEGLHTTVPETYQSANTAAERSEIEVARSHLPEATRTQSGDSMSTSKAPTMTRLKHPCLYPGCPQAFTRPYDLDRHYKTHFPDTVTKLDCPYAPGGFCGREGGRGFTRKDHLAEHVRKVHRVMGSDKAPRRSEGYKPVLPTTYPRYPLKESEEDSSISPISSRYSSENNLAFRNSYTPATSVSSQSTWDKEQENQIIKEEEHLIVKEEEHSIVKGEEHSTAGEKKHLNFEEKETAIAKENEDSRLLLLPKSIRSLLRVIVSIPSDRLWMEKSTDFSFSNRVKASIEQITQESWNWWPFRPTMRKIQHDQTRVHWRCVSTRLLKL